MSARMLDTLQRGPLIYPFLFAIYPILFLWSNNIYEVSIYSSRTSIIFPIVISASITLLLLVGVRGILKDWKIAGLFVAFILLLFFSYGHVLELISVQGIPGLSRNRYLVIIWTVIFIAGTLTLLRYRSNLTSLTNPLNIMSSVLIVFTLPNVIGYTPPPATPLAEQEATMFPKAVSGPAEAGTPPDIYYITAEGYSSERTLQQIFDSDTAPFIDYLKNKDFFIASDSNTNYNSTASSLASSLNMQYLQDLRTDSDVFSRRDGLDLAIQDNKAMRFAREHGYRIVYLSDRFPAGSKGLGDKYFGCGASRLAVHTERYTDKLLHTTALQPILIKFNILEPSQRDGRLCQFFQLAKSKDIAGPKVVVVHLLVPGFPFVVGRDGEAVAGSATSAKPEAYLSQLAWTTKMLEWLVDSLLSDQDYSPVIIIQGDHGEGWVDIDLNEEDQLRRSFGVMNAYHLPDGGADLLYPSISPVNTFRIIFNYYLGADFDLLEDINYLPVCSRLDEICDTLREFDFVNVTEVVGQSSED